MPEEMQSGGTGRWYARGSPSSSFAALGGAVMLSGSAAIMAAEDIQSAAIEDLTRINLDDLIASFGWLDRPLLSALARRLLRNPARKFAHQILEFDTAVGKDGLVSASRDTLPNYVRDVRIYGRDRIPAGPFLALANHPGMSDTLSLFGALNRPDLLIIALERPFLRALPHMTKHLTRLSDKPLREVAVVRKVSAHLRAGGAALSFPAGRIEPDPGARAGAEESLVSWAQSSGIFVRLAPETALLPVLVRGVVWPKVRPGQLMRKERITVEGEKAAAAMQLLANIVLNLRPISVGVHIGRPIYARNLGSTNSQVLHQALLAEMSNLIRDLSYRDGERLI